MNETINMQTPRILKQAFIDGLNYAKRNPPSDEMLSNRALDRKKFDKNIGKLDKGRQHQQNFNDALTWLHNEHGQPPYVPDPKKDEEKIMDFASPNVKTRTALGAGAGGLLGAIGLGLPSAAAGAGVGAFRGAVEKLLPFAEQASWRLENSGLDPQNPEDFSKMLDILSEKPLEGRELRDALSGTVDGAYTGAGKGLLYGGLAGGAALGGLGGYLAYRHAAKKRDELRRTAALLREQGILAPHQMQGQEQQ